MRFWLVTLLLLPLAVRAQTPGMCEPGTAEGVVDVNEVRAVVFNRGNLFFGNQTVSGDGYLVPKETGHSPVFATALWVGGKVDGQIRVSGARYTNFEMWPGPLNAWATLPNPADCSAYDRIFVVSREDVAHYLLTGEMTDDLRDWPVAWGAPALDGDGVEGNYNLAGGDQPAIHGDQTAWWVMNDVGNIHEETGSNPLGIEVRASAFASAGNLLALKQATFYRYVVTNRSPNVIDSAYVSLFMDPDLGDALDDWVGSDTTLSFSYVYNADNDDAAYGIPPAQGYQVVQGPVGLPNGLDDDDDGEVDEQGERLGMTAATFFCGACSNPAANDPTTKEEYYHHLQGRWKDGTPYTASGYGFETDGPVTTFIFPGDPVTDQCWSMANDCEGGDVLATDQRLVVHTGPFRLEPGESTEVVFAMPFAVGADHLNSVTHLRNAAHATREAWRSGMLAPTPVEVEPIPGTFQLQVSPPYPNPFTDQTRIRYFLSEALAVRLAVYDVLGREVAVLVDSEQQPRSYEVVFDGSDLAPGTYIVRFAVAGEERAFSMTKLR